MLEPYEWKRSRTVLRRESGSNPADLVDYMLLYRRDLLSAVLDVLEILSNDVDLFRRIETEFVTTTAAFEALNNRMLKIKNKIAEIDAEDGTKSDSCFSVMYTGG